MKKNRFAEIYKMKFQPLNINENYEFVITDPEIARNIVFMIKKVGYFMDIHPESIMQTLLDYYEKIEKDNDISLNTVCHKGCYECCTNDFEISITEYFMILKYLGINFGYDYIQQYSDKAKKSMSSSSCIFIDCTNGSCSIYEVRPLVCRKYGLYDCTYNCDKLDAERDLLPNMPDTSKNVYFFQHSLMPNKKIMCPNKRIVQWFGNLKDGKLATERMKNLFYASFNKSSDVFIETLFK